jgi:hypothetical protein
MASVGGQDGSRPPEDSENGCPAGRTARVRGGSQVATRLAVAPPTRYRLVVNFMTAAVIRVTVPQALLDRADSVIRQFPSIMRLSRGNPG